MLPCLKVKACCRGQRWLAGPPVAMGLPRGWGHVTGGVKPTCGSKMIQTAGRCWAGAAQGRAVRSYRLQPSDPRVSKREPQDCGIKEF